MTRHRRLADMLVERIVAGRYGVGDRLPTEAELCRVHGMSRGTVRQAMRHLEDEGLVSRRPGAGTIVIGREPVTRYAPFASSTAQIVDFARYTRIQHPSTSELAADADLARRLGAREGSRWFLVQGSRTLKDHDGPPMCWSEQYLRADLPFREMLLRAEFDTASMDSHRIEQEVSAAAMPVAFGEALAAEPGSPALVVVRRHLNRQGDLLSVSFHTHPGDRYAVTSVLLPEDTEQS